MRRFHIYIGFIVWLLTSLFAVSCTDELEGNGYTPNSSSNLHVLVPTVLSANGTRTDDASGLPTYNATVDECQINDLTLYAFPTGNEGKLLVETLPAPLATMMVEPHVANYQLNIEPGTYHIYVVANMNKVLSGSGQTIKTEDDLKKIVLNYEVGTEPGMPVSTNIPMIYEPKDVNGNIIDTKIESGKKYTEVAANLKFTCVKVKLNLIMDPTASDNLYDKSYSITDIVAQKLTPSTHLLWDGKFTQSESDVTSVYATGIENTIYPSLSTGEASTGRYYQNGEYTIDENNANENNKDVVSITDRTNKGKDAPTNLKQWLFQGTYYLPERYISKAEEQSVLKISGKVNNSNKNQYTIKLGHKQNASDAVPTFPRGTYYEITGKLKSYGDMDLDCNVKVSDWSPEEINADFYHTTLWVNKTKAEVSSTKSDTISYKSSETTIVFGCVDSKIVGGTNKDVIIETKRDGNNIIFGINPQIPIDQFEKDLATGKREGTARVYLQANNIKKYITVHYDVTPYFKVSPKNVVIYWGKDPDEKQVLEKHFVVETNLGGLKAFQNINGTLTPKTSGSTAQVGNAPSRLEINYDNTPNADGKYLMKVKETVNPVTTTVYNFTLSPLKNIDGDEVASQEVTVTVKPEFGPYRIYMRAINDIYSWSGNPYLGGDDQEKDNKDDKKEKLKVQFKEQFAEYTGANSSYSDNNNHNWYDGWYYDTNNGYNWEGDKSIHQDKHYMYMYAQNGENNGNTISNTVWLFTDEFPGEKMEGDVNNAGWYYKDMAFDAENKGSKNEGDPKVKKKIKPGRTLVIFGNGRNHDNGGCTPHRFPHFMDPGIPLFNYEDREGWYLYDPTCLPYYRVYDDKPTIINVNYVIYTKNEIKKWKIRFGKSSSSKESYTLKCDPDHFKENNVKNGDWYRTVLNFKAPKGEYERAIEICFDDSSEGTMLFDGDSYKCTYDATKGYQIFGYYDGSSWHEGKPTGVSK